MIFDFHRSTNSAQGAGPVAGGAFALTLPPGTGEARRQAGASAESRRLPATPLHPLRILLVEDHYNSAAIISRLLRPMGYEIAHAATIAEALRIAENEMRSAGLDLVISDLGLPDGSGLDMMRKLSTEFGLRGIALSGFGTDSDRAESMAAGFDRHLTKPIDIADLRSAIVDLARPYDQPWREKKI
jgi:CheY-like chemotaxis protein